MAKKSRTKARETQQAALAPGELLFLQTEEAAAEVTSAYVRGWTEERR